MQVPHPRRTTPLLSVASAALPGWDVDQVVEGLAAVDVHALEVSVGSSGLIGIGRPEGARSLGHRLRDGGIRVWGVDATIELTFLSAEAPSVLAAASALDAGFVRFFAPEYDRRRSFSEQVAAAAGTLAGLVATGQGLTPQVSVLVEIAPGTIAPSPELACRLLDASGPETGRDPPAGVVFDPGSMVAEGYLQPELAVALLGQRLHHVHVKNRLIARVGGEWSAVSRTLADGLVDWPRTITALWAAGYRGAYTLDHLSGPTTIRSLGADVAELRVLLATYPRDEMDPLSEGATRP